MTFFLGSFLLGAKTWLFMKGNPLPHSTGVSELGWGGQETQEAKTHSRRGEDQTSSHILGGLWYRCSDSKTVSHLSSRPGLAPGEAINLWFHFQPFSSHFRAPVEDSPSHWKLLKRQVHFFGLSALFSGVFRFVKKNTHTYSPFKVLLQVLTRFLVPC